MHRRCVLTAMIEWCVWLHLTTLENEVGAGAGALPPKEKVELATGGCVVRAGVGAGLVGAVLVPPNEKLGAVDAVLDDSPPNEIVGLAAPESDVRPPNEIVELVFLGSSPLDDKLLRGGSNGAPKFKEGFTSV